MAKDENEIELNGEIAGILFEKRYVPLEISSNPASLQAWWAGLKEERRQTISRDVVETAEFEHELVRREEWQGKREEWHRNKFKGGWRGWLGNWIPAITGIRWLVYAPGSQKWWAIAVFVGGSLLMHLVINAYDSLRENPKRPNRKDGREDAKEKAAPPWPDGKHDPAAVSRVDGLWQTHSDELWQTWKGTDFETRVALGDLFTQYLAWRWPCEYSELRHHRVGETVVRQAIANVKPAFLVGYMFEKGWISHYEHMQWNQFQGEALADVVRSKLPRAKAKGPAYASAFYQVACRGFKMARVRGL